MTQPNTLNTKKEAAMPIPTKPNPRKYTLTMKVTKDVYTKFTNEAERTDVPVSRLVLETFEKGLGVQKIG